MKNHCTPECSRAAEWSLAPLVLIGLLQWSTLTQAGAQVIGEISMTTDENPYSLLVENVKTHSSEIFVRSQSVNYKLRSGKYFEKGQISQITDSAVSFEDKKSGTIAVHYRELLALRKSNTAKVVIGGCLLVGSVAGILAINAAGPGPGAGMNGLAAIPLIPVAATGLALMVIPTKSFNLEKSWQVTATRAIVPGNVLTIIMKNGEVVKLKVASIDSQRITGSEVRGTVTQEGTRHMSRTILISDIQECSRNIR